MDWVVIDGVKPYDGRYEFDLAGMEPTVKEWGWIKRFSGYMPATIQEGLEGVDPELLTAFAVIALHRAGRVDKRDVADVFERIADHPFAATIRLESDSAPVEEEGDAGPPALSSNGSTADSGPTSKKSSARSAPNPSPTGTPASATSASAPARSET